VLLAFCAVSGKAAEGELKVLIDQGYNIEENDLIRHNLVVFRSVVCPAGALPDAVADAHHPLRV
jgi:hypothetical protein